MVAFELLETLMGPDEHGSAEERILRIAERVLKKWRFALSVDGALWVQPIGATVQMREIASLIKRLKCACLGNGPRQLVIDLSEAEIAEHEWSVVPLLIRALSRAIGAEVRTIGQGMARDALIERMGFSRARGDTGVRKDAVGWAVPAKASRHLCFVLDRSGAGRQ